LAGAEATSVLACSLDITLVTVSIDTSIISTQPGTISRFTIETHKGEGRIIGALLCDDRWNRDDEEECHKETSR
jgi:hypothetical protein